MSTSLINRLSPWLHFHPLNANSLGHAAGDEFGMHGTGGGLGITALRSRACA